MWAPLRLPWPKPAKVDNQLAWAVYDYWQRQVDQVIEEETFKFYQKHPRDFDLRFLQGLS